jgi:radical SAM protein (TIGR01212 family)
MVWGNKRFNNIDYFLKEKFGEKVFKVSLDGGFTCPNRDGKISTEACLFCSESGSGEFAGDRRKTIFEQIEEQIEFLQKGKERKYIAYFQNFTNTYGKVEYLRKIYEEALSHPNIVGIAIGTRADCMDREILELLSEINKKTLLWIEIGLQSSNDKTAQIINRGYTTEVFLKKVEELKERNIKVLAHVIIGLPKETEKEVLETIYFLNKIKIWGVKIHLLYILKNTKLYNYYEKFPWKIMTKEEYIKIVCRVIKVLDKNIVIHRLTGDAPWKDLYEPKWSTDKRGILNGITKELLKMDIFQGKGE